MPRSPLALGFLLAIYNMFYFEAAGADHLAHPADPLHPPGHGVVDEP